MAFWNAPSETAFSLVKCKKETKAWLQALGTQKLPLGGTKFGLVRTLPFTEDIVKMVGANRTGRFSRDSEGSLAQEQVDRLTRKALVQQANKKAEVMRRDGPKSTGTVTDYSAAYSVADILQSVNSTDTPKYIPNSFLSDAKKESAALLPAITGNLLRLPIPVSL